MVATAWLLVVALAAGSLSQEAVNGVVEAGVAAIRRVSRA
jgi:hypothetical protein